MKKPSSCPKYVTVALTMAVTFSSELQQRYFGTHIGCVGVPTSQHNGASGQSHGFEPPHVRLRMCR